MGVSLRNNYQYKFGLNNYGSDPSACMTRYRGPIYFSEAESNAIE